MLMAPMRENTSAGWNCGQWLNLAGAAVALPASASIRRTAPQRFVIAP